MDNDHSGFLEVSELKEAIGKVDKTMTLKEIDNIIKELDFADNDKINYTEFLAATIDVKDFFNESRLRAVFNTFDIDNTGEITADNLRQAFSKFGREISSAEIKQIM